MTVNHIATQMMDQLGIFCANQETADPHELLTKLMDLVDVPRTQDLTTSACSTWEEWRENLTSVQKQELAECQMVLSPMPAIERFTNIHKIPPIYKLPVLLVSIVVYMIRDMHEDRFDIRSDVWNRFYEGWGTLVICTLVE